MKAAQFYGKQDVRLVDLPPTKPKEHEALVAIEWCGICGSDMHEYAYGAGSIPTKDRPHPLTGESLPVTMGHEFCGRILSAPAGSGLTPGQAVVVDPRIFCRSCTPCKSGSTQCCTVPLGFKGLSGTGGGFSETVAIDATLCYPIPDTADLALAALIEPLAVAWHAVALCEIADWSNKSVLILGGGPVGIAHIFVLRSFGCKDIFVSEPTAKRAAQNQKLASAVFNPLTENVEEKCRELTGGEGVDVVFDCAGSAPALEVGMYTLRSHGTYMNVSMWPAPLPVPFLALFMRELTIKSSLAYDDQHFKETVEAFAAGKFKGIEAMITSRIHLDDITKKGFEELLTNKDEHIKILVTPDRSKVPPRHSSGDLFKHNL